MQRHCRRSSSPTPDFAQEIIDVGGDWFPPGADDGVQGAVGRLIHAGYRGACGRAPRPTFLTRPRVYQI